MERKHKYILDTARALKFQANLSKRYWGECVQTAIYIINRLPSKVLSGRSPYELLHKIKLSLSHLRVFGCLCYSTNLVKEDNFVPRAKKAVLLGYSSTQKGYVLLDLENNYFLISRDVTFRESIFPFKESQM